MIVLRQDSLEGELELLNAYAGYLDNCLDCIRELTYYDSDKYVTDTIHKELSMVNKSIQILENQIENTECIDD